MNRVQRVWAHRTASEYRSAALAAEMHHWTLRLGLSPDTARLAHRVAADELDHAELCFGVYTAAGGIEAAAPVPDQWLVLQQEPDLPLELRAVAVAADEYAVAETVALQLFKEMARHAVAPSVAPVVTRIVADEARHSRFGWVALDELLERTGAEGRALLQARFPDYIERVRRDYETAAASCTDEERAWGLLDSSVYAEITTRALAGVEQRMRRLLEAC